MNLKFIFFYTKPIKGIASDLFPGITLPEPDYVVFNQACRDTCEANNKQCTDFFLEKMQQVRSRSALYAVVLDLARLSSSESVRIRANGSLRLAYARIAMWSFKAKLHDMPPTICTEFPSPYKHVVVFVQQTTNVRAFISRPHTHSHTKPRTQSSSI